MSLLGRLRREEKGEQHYPVRHEHHPLDRLPVGPALQVLREVKEQVEGEEEEEEDRDRPRPVAAA